MSKTIDEKVVSMQFDNANFEKNVQTSMSTLDKLKHALKLDGASKGFDELSASAKRCDVSPLSKGLDTVQAKFSALQVIGITALANITNSAINTGKQLVSAFTIDPVKTGFQEYELKMGSVQTIMASTGESLETVNKYLEELNEYSDRTIYSFSDMTQNIGKFTNAGVKLDDAVLAIKGISNEAAISGANANEASRAMYNFAQALSAGYVKLIDWKSIENANMATVEFKNQLLEAAVAAGTLEKQSDGMYRVLTTNANGSTMDEAISATRNFNDSLAYQWMTTDALVGTLKDYADETTDIGKKAYASAQDVKTFSMMMDTLKEAAQSGWAQTWELIIGDFNEAKNLWTDLSEIFGGFISNSADARNAVLESAFASNWDKVKKQISEAGISVEDFKNKVSETAKAQGIDVDKLIEQYGSLDKAITEGAIAKGVVVDALKDIAYAEQDLSKTNDEIVAKNKELIDIVNKTANGVFGNVDTGRIQAITDAGYDYATVQELVNKVVAGETITVQELSDAQLANLGYTEDQITALRDLADQAEATGTPLNELINDLEKPSGRDLLIGSVKNALTGLTTVLSSVKTAWNDIFFPDMSGDQIIEAKANFIYKIAEAIRKFSEKLAIAKEDINKTGTTANTLMRTFKGLFAIVDVVRTVVGGAFSAAFRVVSAVLGKMGFSILDITAYVGDAVVSFRDWIMSNEYIVAGFEALVNGIVYVIEFIGKVITAVREWINEFMQIPGVQQIITDFKDNVLNAFSSIREYFAGGAKVISDFKDRVDALGKLDINDLSAIFKDFRDNVLGYFLNVDFSLSGIVTKVRESAGKLKDDLIAKLGLAGDKFDWVIEKAQKFVAYVRSKIPAAISIGLGALLIQSITKIADVLELLTGPLGGVTKLLEALASGLTGIGKAVSKYLKAQAFKATAEGIKNIAIAVAILAGAIYLLSTIDDPAKLWSAVGAIAAIMAVMSLLAFAVSKINIKDTVKIAGVGAMILGIGAAMLMLAGVTKILGSMSPEELAKGVIATAFLGGIITGLIAASKLAGPDIDKVGPMILKIGVAFLMLAATLKIISSMTVGELTKGIIVTVLFGGIIVGLIAATQLAGKEINKVGSTILKISIALLLLVAVIKIASRLSAEEFFKGALVIAGLEALILALIAVSQLAGENASKAGSMILKIGIALLILVGVIKLAASLTESEIKQGLYVIGALELLMMGLIAVSNLAGQYSVRAGVMLILMAGSLLILTGVIHLLKDIPEDQLQNVVKALAVMELAFMGLIAVTKLAQDCMGTLIVLTVAIGVMAGAILLLAQLDSGDLGAATVALGSVMVAFALLIASTKLVNTTDWLKTLGLLAGVTLVVAALAMIIWRLSKCDPAGAIAAGAALSILLMSLSASLYILSKVGDKANKALAPALALVGIVALLAIIIGVLAYLDVGSTLEIAASLSILLISLSASCVILSAVGKKATKALLPALALVGIVALLAAIIVALAYLDVGSTLGIAASLSIMLLSLSAACVILSFVGKAGLAALIGVGVLLALIISMGALMTLIGNYADKFENIDKGIEILNKVGHGIGSFIGNIMGGFIEGLASGLPALGQCLSDFMTNSLSFFDGISNVSGESLNGVKNLAQMILILSAANLVDGIARFITGESSMTKFATELVPFGKAMTDFSKTVSGKIDEGAVTAAANAGKVMAEMAKTIPNTGGVAGFFAGENDMSIFATQLVPFGKAMVKFSETVAGKIDATAVEAAANAGSVMAQMAKTIPNTGGLVSFFAGDNNMAVFGAQLVIFGGAMVLFSSIVAGKIDQSAVEAAATAGMTMVEMSKTIPNTGGLISFFTGDNDMATFGMQLVIFGKAMVSFSSTVAGKIDAEAVTAAANAGMLLAGLNNSLPKTGGWKKIFGGQKDMQTFSNGIVAFGQAMVDFSSKISGNLDPAAVSSSIRSARSLVSLMKDMSGMDISGVGTFTAGLATLGAASVNTFVNAFKDAVPKVTAAASSMMAAVGKGATSKASTVSAAFSKALATSVTSMKSRLAMFNVVGVQAMAKLAQGIRVGNANVGPALVSSLSTACTKAKGYYGSFYSAGIYLAQGFAMGIQAGAWRSKVAAQAMASAAVQTVRNALKINSPSKVFRSIGSSVPEGFAQGIGKFGDKIKSSSIGMADVALSSTQDALAKIGDVVTNGINAEPSIRPVIDMTSVSMRGLQLNSSLDASLVRPVNSLSQIVATAQNAIDASNKEVVAAVNSLREDLNAYTARELPETALYVDSKKLASSIAKPMDRQLNILSQRRSY